VPLFTLLFVLTFVDVLVLALLLLFVLVLVLSTVEVDVVVLLLLLVLVLVTADVLVDVLLVSTRVCESYCAVAVMVTNAAVIPAIIFMVDILSAPRLHSHVI
jgi:hypothetical protein